MFKKKFKRFKNKKTEKIEILDINEPVKKTKNNQKIKFPKIKNKIKFATTCVAILAVFILVLSITTGTNVLSVSAKKFLSSLGIYTEEVKKVEIQSDDYDNPGSWHIDKSAGWTELGKAKIRFDLNTIAKTKEDRYKDIIIVLDISGSMRGEKIDKVKQDCSELIEYILSDPHNSVALITFSSTSEILSDFTTDKTELLNKLDSITVDGYTNYNAPLKNVDEVMKEYVQKNNTDTLTLFITDGVPCVDTPNQITTYEILKEKYPYMEIDGVQYEIGFGVTSELAEISDKQWATTALDFKSILYEIITAPLPYEKFQVIDYINEEQFYVESADDIEVSEGTVSLENENGTQKVVWDLGNNSFISGESPRMFITANIKQQYIDTDGYYPTNKKETIITKLPEENEKIVESTKTPVLKTKFEVIYDTNTPNGCTLASIPKEKYSPYQNVTIKQEELSCKGYTFKGWEIVDEDYEKVTKVNDDVFQMPFFDVHIKAVWAKQSIVKSMDGTLQKNGELLYNVLKDEATSGVLAKEYTGNHQDSFDGNGTDKIYYFYGSDYRNAVSIQDKNNVLFAGSCWKMIRTTDTGGVKLLYNGAALNDKCTGTDERGMHAVYSELIATSVLASYNSYYGTSYTYDEATKKFKIAGDTERAIWSSTTGEDLVGKYTCNNTNADASCNTLYYVVSYNSDTKANVMQLSIGNTTSLGKMQFNHGGSNPKDGIGSLAYTGYMYNTVYDNESKQPVPMETLLSNNLIQSYGQYYSEEIVYDRRSNKYSLVDPKIRTDIDPSELIGKYMLDYKSNAVYIVGISSNGTTVYYKYLSAGQTLDDVNFSYTYGDSFTNNGDGTYTINNPTTIKISDWYTKKNDLKNKFVCSKTDDNTCTDLKYIVLVNDIGFEYTSIYKYGNTFTYDSTTGKYTLSGEIQTLWDYPNYYNRINNTHYTCFNDSGVCDTLYYVYYAYTSSSSFTSVKMYYTKLTGGKDINSALNEMLRDNNVNKRNSVVKSAVDAWYERYLTEYSDYIEDTVYCNNRNIATSGGFNPNGGSTLQLLTFKEYTTNTDLKCSNNLDMFSTKNENAKLKYPIGLMTAPEMNLLGNSTMKSFLASSSYWLLSASKLDGLHSYNSTISSGGGLSLAATVADYSNYSPTAGYDNLRPAISLKKGTQYIGGNGSKDNPYLIKDYD